MLSVRSKIITFGLGLWVLFLGPHKVCLAQGTQTGVVLTKLVQPIYPPLARAAHITGDVDLLITVRADGVVETVVVTSGHPLLEQSAMTSAQQSQFECRECREPLTKYRLVYSFEIEGECECEPKDTQSKQSGQQTYPRVTHAENRVTVVAHILCTCDPAVTIKARSLKCLYLWNCSSKS